MSVHPRIHVSVETLEEWSLELEGSRETIERLAEFASEMAADNDAYKEVVNELEDERIDRLVNGDGDVALWRGLCHSRAVQLNEAYDLIARLRSQVCDLQGRVNEMEDQLLRWRIGL